jgi:hypothetical protein
LVGKANKCVSQKLFQVLGNLMWRNVSKSDPSREPQTIFFLFSFFSFLAGEFFYGFYAGRKKKKTLEKHFFFNSFLKNSIKEQNVPLQQ